MKKYLFWLMLFPLAGLSQPYLTQNFDGADTLPNQSVEIFIDTSQTNIWQIGPPQKVIFDSPYSVPNVLVTDTVNTIPDSTSSYFEFSLPPGFLGFFTSNTMDSKIRPRHNK